LIEVALTTPSVQTEEYVMTMEDVEIEGEAPTRKNNDLRF